MLGFRSAHHAEAAALVPSAEVVLEPTYVTEALTPGLPSPDPELTARMLSALADEAVRLALTEPERFDEERILRLADWLLARLAG